VDAAERQPGDRPRVPSREESPYFWPVWAYDSGFSMLARYVAPRAVASAGSDLIAGLSEEEEQLSAEEQDRMRAMRLYERLRGKKITYGLEPWASEEGVQQIRHPWWLLSDRHGTCVDIAATYAAMCLQEQVGAMLAVTGDHAFVAFQPGRLRAAEELGPLDLKGFEPARRGDESVDPGVHVGTIAALGKAIADRALVAVDVVALTDPAADFESAVEAISDAVAEGGEGDVWLVDVPFLHRQAWFEVLDPPSASRPSIRMRVPAGDAFEEFPSQRKAIAELRGGEGTFALVGDSGRGKSTLARHLAENAAFGAAWFLDASDRKALLNSLAMAMQVDMGRPELEVPEAERKALAETALARLRAATGPWLVVLDNADGDPTSIRDLLPVPKEGQLLLITSTNEEWSTFCPAVPLPPVDAGEADRFRGEEIAGLVEGRPLLLDAFSKLDPEADWAAVELAPPPGDLEPELRGPAVYWSLLRAHPGFGSSHLEVAALAAFMPANGQPVAALAELARDGKPAVEFLIDHGLMRVDRNMGMVRLHRLFGAAIRADLEAGEEDLCDRMVRLLTADDRARAALDEHGDMATAGRLDERLGKIDERTAEPDRGLGVSLHAIAMLLELHGHTRRSGLTFERAERHLKDDPGRRADCLLGRARTINQHHKKERERLEEAIGWAREARQLKLAAGAEGPAYRALAMEGLLKRPLANFPVPGKTRRDLLDEAQEILEKADDRRQALSDDEVPLAEKARSRYNLAGVRIPKAQESPARAAEHLEIAERIYSEVAEWRTQIYGRMVHPHIAACVNGLALVAYYRAMLLPADDARRTAWLRTATEYAVEALKQREVLDGSVDADEAAKSAALLAKIALARGASSPAKSLEDADGVADEAMEELRRSDRLPAPPPSLPPGREGLLEGIDRWARSRALREAVGAFGELPPDDLDLRDLLEWLDRFSDRWDFRKGERDVGTPPEFPATTRKAVEAAAAALGLVTDGSEPQGRYDYVLILGGLARACLARPLYTARLLGKGELEANEIFAIGAFRGLSEGEVELLRSVAETSAGDEFEAMDLGMRRAFDLAEPDGSQGEDHENPNASWRIHDYTTAAGASLHVAAAPSTEPEVRRANTADTLAWLAATRMELGPGQRLLIVTTDIYVPFQKADALRLLALPHEVAVEVAGVVPGLVDRRLAHEFTPDKYLQEIRSTIRSLRRLHETLSTEA
jgi:hypothetical protein